MSPRSLRRAYLEWVEEQVEAFKESIPRGDLLRLADEVVSELRVGDHGQYQLTELLLCTAIDRRITRMLRLPGYRAWCAERRQEPLPVRPPSAPAPPVSLVEEAVEEMEPLESVA
ncbi:MAG TPA: hypothetical protein VGR37_04775 [Longimicrobiaceae bacterium]|nr:hypothetical protein [Longimicrobiaceae bacterium]